MKTDFEWKRPVGEFGSELASIDPFPLDIDKYSFI
jgi:hypothetical protein